MTIAEAEKYLRTKDISRWIAAGVLRARAVDRRTYDILEEDLLVLARAGIGRPPCEVPMAERTPLNMRETEEFLGMLRCTLNVRRRDGELPIVLFANSRPRYEVAALRELRDHLREDGRYRRQYTPQHFQMCPPSASTLPL